MDVLAIKKYGRLVSSQEDVVECTLYKKHEVIWHCPDPGDKIETGRLEEEYKKGEWSGKESRWITEEEHQKWSFKHLNT